MPNAPREKAAQLNCTAHEALAEYIGARAKAANLSKAQMLAMILTRWALEGGPAVDQIDQIKLTPGLRLRACEIGREAAEWHGWANFLAPPAPGELREIPAVPPVANPLTVKVPQRSSPQARSESA
jgi:hypothetical protein